MASIIIAQPAESGSWHACIVDSGDRSIRGKQFLKAGTPSTESGANSLGFMARQVLSRSGARDVQSLVLLLNANKLIEPSVIAWQGSLVQLYAIDPLSPLEHIIPKTWDSFMLVDHRGAREIALVIRNRFGELERTHSAALNVQASGTVPSSIGNSLSGRENEKRAENTFANQCDFLHLCEVARFFKINKVVCQHGLLDTAGSEREPFDASACCGAVELFETLCVPKEELIYSSLTLCLDASRGAVRLIESDGAATLRMSSTKLTSYDIVHPIRPVLDLQEEALSQMVDGRPILLVLDTNIERLYGKQIDTYSAKHLKCLGKVIVAGSEQCKSWEQVQSICSDALLSELPRDGVIVAFGGGVTLDLAGMAASIFRRGVPYLRIPTTLVGLADVGVGIKQGFNFESKKNALGAFYPPLGGISDLTFLRTLPEAELRCGLAEIIKIALVLDSNLFELLETVAASLICTHFRSPKDAAMRVLLRSELLMMQQLQPNLYEACHARLVDFGHTFSPRLESESGYSMRHGEAVALDMLVSIGVAVTCGLCSESLFARVLSLYRTLGLPTHSPLLQIKSLMDSAEEVRRHRSGKLNLVVPCDLGSATYLQDLKPEHLKTALAMMEHSKNGTYSARAAGVGL
jgi:2-epi-5-epi-valiolone synthase